MEELQAREFLEKLKLLLGEFVYDNGCCKFYIWSCEDCPLKQTIVEEDMTHLNICSLLGMINHKIKDLF